MTVPIEFVVMLAVSSFASGFFACLVLWHRAMRRDLRQIQRVDDAFEDYVKIVNHPPTSGVWR